MKWLRFLLVLVVVLGLDIASKVYVHGHIPYLGLSMFTYPYGGIGVFQGVLGGIDFSINHVHNTGAAWGALSSYQAALIVFRLLAIAGMIVYFFAFNKVKGREIPLLMVIAGALGNVFDTFFYGYVIDFFHFRFWGYTYPLFNVADSAIFCGVAFLIIHSMRAKRRESVVHADRENP